MKLPTAPPGSADTASAIREAIEQSLPGAEVRVTRGSPGHFSVDVVSEEFRGKTRVVCQRLVYRALAPLLTGERAPVHAIDLLQTRPPAG